MQWRTVPFDRALADRLAAEKALPWPAAAVLVGRGLVDASAVHGFLNPRLAEVTDPFLLPGMAPAADRILRAVRTRERIAVYGDYDVDGVTATALMVTVLRRLGADVQPFLPNRIDEGYGMSADGLQRCMEEAGPGLIVTVDCGTSSTGSVDLARSAGIDVVITDHHEPGERLAQPVALVNPKLAGSPEPTRTLAGVGVAFKLCHALLKKARAENLPGDDFDLRTVLDLVAIGTVADVVMLTGENRILVRHGIERLRRTSCAGLRALMDAAGVGDGVDTYHLGFVIGPRLNAAGRMGSANSALKLLLTSDEGEARDMARLLDEANRERRRVEDAMREAAESEIKGWFNPGEHFGLVVGREGWHPGTVGLVASRLCSRYSRPAVVISFDSDGNGRGSCRSVEAVDILERLKACASLLESFGGHKVAAGIAIRRERLELFREQFNASCAEVMRDTDLRPVQTVDAWIQLQEADDRLLDALRQFKPMGMGNPAPVWGLRGVRVSGEPRRVGKDAMHLQMTLESDGVQIRAVAFNMGHLKLTSGAELDVLAHLEENEFKGRCTPQLNIRDLAPAV